MSFTLSPDQISTLIGAVGKVGVAAVESGSTGPGTSENQAKENSETDNNEKSRDQHQIWKTLLR